ncbi:unnamed protein product [Penicillium nalgiovense]|nr:unnamed protein product [Penicillium nalgiovense]
MTKNASLPGQKILPPTIPLQPPPTITLRSASEREDDEKLLTIGTCTEVYLVDDHIIRKIPRRQSEEDRQPILRKALVYDTLGNPLVFIHGRGDIHSELALRQFSIDDNFDLQLGDPNSSWCPSYVAFGYEKASHCLPRYYGLPNSEASDVFALGSTLYKLVTSEALYN